MADKVGSAEIELRATLASFRRDLGEAERATRRSADSMQSNATRAGRAFSSVGSDFRRNMADASANVARVNAQVSGLARDLRAAFIVGGSAIVAREAVQLADQYTQLSARIRLVITESESFAQVQENLFRIAQRNRAGIADVTTLYVRLRSAIAGLGGPEAESIVETLSQTLAISGASAQETASFLRQISQALASGVLRGDEFNSVMENNSRFARLLADQLGVSVGALRSMAEEGELTADIIRNAIAGGAGQIADEFNRIPLTVSGAATQLQNALAKFVGETDKAHSASARLAEGISLLAQNFDTIADALLLVGALVASSVFGGAAGAAFSRLAAQIAAAGASASATSLAMRALAASTTVASSAFRGLLALLGGPVGIILSAVSLGFFAVSQNASRAGQAASSAAAALSLIANATPAVDANADSMGRAADEAGRLSRLTGDAADAAQRLAQNQRESARATDAQRRAAEALTEVRKAEAVASIESALADQRAALSSIRSRAFLRGFGSAFGVQEYTSEERQEMSRLEEVIRILTEGLEAVRSGALNTPLGGGGGGAGGGAGAGESSGRYDPNAIRNQNFDRTEIGDDGLRGRMTRREELSTPRRSEAADNFLNGLAPGTNPAVAFGIINGLVQTGQIRASEINELVQAVLQLKRAFGPINDVNDPVRRLELLRARVLELRNAAGGAVAASPVFDDLLDEAEIDATIERIGRVEGAIETFADGTDAARETIGRLREDMELFRALGGVDSYFEAVTTALEEMARASGDSAEAMRELLETHVMLGTVDPDKYREAQRRIVQAGRVGRAERDERENRFFRPEEIRDDVKKGLRAAVETGDWRQSFQDAIAQAFERAANRALDNIVDVLFDAVSGSLRGNGGIFGAIGSLFGGFRAHGGSMGAGRVYIAGERGPEPIFMGNSGTAVSNDALRQALSSPSRGSANVQQVFNIDARGADAGMAQRLRAIVEQAAAKGARMGAELVERSAYEGSSR